MKLTEEKRLRRNEAARRWRALRPERNRELIARAKAKKPEKYKEINRFKYLRWKLEKPDALKAIQRKAGKKFRLKKTWLLPENKDKNRERSRIWRERHPGLTTARVNSWKKQNPERSGALSKNANMKRRGAVGRFRPEEWERKKKKYFYTCPRCGKSEPQIILTVDHIIPISLGGWNTIGNIQPLCLPCNLKKRVKIIIYLPICGII